MKKSVKALFLIALVSLAGLTISMMTLDKARIKKIKRNFQENRLEMKVEVNGMNVGSRLGKNGFTIGSYGNEDFVDSTGKVPGKQKIEDSFLLSEVQEISIDQANLSVKILEGEDQENIQLKLEIPEDWKNSYDYSAKLKGKTLDIDFKTYPLDKDWGQARLLILVPKENQLSLDVDSVNGPLDCQGIPSVQVSSVNGTIFVGGAKKIQAESVGGDINLDYEATDIQVESVKGSITIQPKKAYDAHFKLEGVFGELVYEDQNLTKPADFTVGSGQNEIKISTVNGSIFIMPF